MSSIRKRLSECKSSFQKSNGEKRHVKYFNESSDT